MLTTHARTRMQQRGILAAVIDDLLTWGRAEHDHHGGTILYFDRSARATTRRSSRAYLVLSNDGSVITVGHRVRRLPRA
jgi:hypothetical protein